MRYIRGKIYNNDQAWQIYTAVTSRGRDPGIMDRPDEQDYHTQIYPVLPKQNLRVIVDLVQQMPVTYGEAHFTLPLLQSSEVISPAKVHAQVDIVGVRPKYVGYLDSNYTELKPSEDGSVVELNGKWLPRTDYIVDIDRRGMRTAVFSRLPSGQRTGAFAATIDTKLKLVHPRVSVINGHGVRLGTPTTDSDGSSADMLAVTGRYNHPCQLRLAIHSDNHPVILASLQLTARRVTDSENPAAKLWADTRIAALQNSPRDRQAEVVALSRRYTVVSKFTALLAIPAEELARYRLLQAQQAVHTNTDTIGGGGGDPLLSVNAPEDARQVVAVFPDGTTKNLDYDAGKRVWTTRFDYPLGTPAGEYDVTIIVVQADGRRTRLILTYSNLLDAPKLDAFGEQTASASGAVHIASVQVTGDAIAKAVLVAPWGERVAMHQSAPGGAWSGAVAAPRDWPSGATVLTVVCYDGAHNRSEVQVNVDLR